VPATRGISFPVRHQSHLEARRRRSISVDWAASEATDRPPKLVPFKADELIADRGGQNPARAASLTLTHTTCLGSVSTNVEQIRCAAIQGRCHCRPPRIAITSTCLFAGAFGDQPLDWRAATVVGQHVRVVRAWPRRGSSTRRGAVLSSYRSYRGGLDAHSCSCAHP